MKSKKIQRFIWVSIMGIALCVGIGLASFQIMLSDLPKLDRVEDYKPYQVSRVYDSSLNLLADFYIEKRTVIPIQSLPSIVKNAFLAAEDADFYRHQGIDYWGVARAVLNEIKYKLIGGQRVGGSTITQQIAKTMLLTRQKTYTRKIKEFILAQRIEETLNKEQILSLYLNQIYFGNGAYGIEEAAKTYYGVRARDLTLSQAASLAAVPKSPNKINPIKDPVRLKERRDYVIEQMLMNNFITPAMAYAAKEEPIVVNPRLHPYLNQAPYYAEEVKRFLIERFGEDALYRDGLKIYTGIHMPIQVAANEALKWGLRVLDKRQGYRGPIARLPNHQATALAQRIRESNRHLKRQDIVQGVIESISSAKEEAVIQIGSREKGILPLSNILWARSFNPNAFTPAPKSLGALFKVGDVILVRIDQLSPKIQLSLEQKPLAEGALVAIHPQTHHVLAMVGGYDFASSTFNRATEAKRQPGSSFKPFVYALAVDQGKATPASIIDDSPKEYSDWRPRNNDRKFLGEITLRRCLVSSVNMCSISLLERVGVGAVLDLAKSAGEVTPQNPLPRDLTLALGSGEVFPWLHVNAFSIFPNAGKIGEPIIVERVEAANGDLLYQVLPEEHEVIKASTAFVMTNMMRGLMSGAGRRITGLSAPLAGKTGTTNDFRSAWFVGFSQDLLAGVYVGFDDNRSLGRNEYGAVAALPIWGRFMTKALGIMPPREFIQPEGIVWRLIDQKTGKIASSNQIYDPDAQARVNLDESELESQSPTADQEQVIPPVMEAFIAGTEPGGSGMSPPPQEMPEGKMPFPALPSLVPALKMPP